MRPLESSINNKLEMFNETCIMIISYHLFAFTSYLDNPYIRYNLGYIVISIVTLNLLINMLLLLVTTYMNFKKSIPKLKQDLTKTLKKDAV